MGDLPSGTVTLLFTDIEGSTDRLRLLGDQYGQVLSAHRDILRTAFRSHGGVEVDTQGDAFFVAFPRATDAVAAAVDAQRALAGYSWPEDGTIRVRMGLHTGEPRRTAEGYYGLDLHRGARIMAAGHGGQVLLSQATADLAGQALPDGVQLRDLGQHRLKDLTASEHLYQLDIWGLPVDFPPVRSLGSRPNNLPTPPSSLIGREREVETLVGLLRRNDVRLVTLTGAGGAGKTRLALQAAAEALHDFEDGVFFVALAPFSDPALVVPTLAQTLGVAEAPQRPLIENVAAFLRDKRPLLVLDNFEHVLAAADQIGYLLAACPRVTVLTTSRAPLRLTGEREMPVPPLAFPEPARPQPVALVSGYPAVRLFVERAEAVRPGFALSADDAAAVAEICARLDGLPLTIELAAARVKTLPPRALLGQLEHRLTLLTGGARDLPARQRTLRDAITWSHNLLTEDERVLFRRLAVFAGGCTLEAARAVCGGMDSLAIDVLGGLSALVDNSLLVQVDGLDPGAPGQTGEPRFTMLETIREFGLEQLDRSDDAEPVRRRYAAYIVELVEAAEEPLLTAARDQWMARLDAEQANIRAALAWAAERADAEVLQRLVGVLWWYWYQRGTLREGRRWAEQALAFPAVAETSRARAKALYAHGYLAWWHTDYATAADALAESVALWRTLSGPRGLARALAWLGALWRAPGAARRSLEGLALARAIGDDWSASFALFWLGFAAVTCGAPVAARRHMSELLEIGETTGDPLFLALAHYSLGILALSEEDIDAAADHLATALPLARSVTQPTWIATVLVPVGYVALDQGDPVRAAQALTEALSICHETEWMLAIATTLQALARLALVRGQTIQAARLFGAVETIHAVMGRRMETPYDRQVERTLMATRDALGDAAFDAARARGRRLPLAQAIAEALAVAAEPAEA